MATAAPTPLHDGLLERWEQTVRLPAFEGPLDLLLFLIRQQEIDIYDIPVAEVTAQYLAILRGMESLQLEVAGEFLVMAATLMEIKSRMLLPREQQRPLEEGGEEGPDPRWELVQQLLEYRRMKEASQELETLIARSQGKVFREAEETTATTASVRPLEPVDRLRLWETFNRILRRLAERLEVGVIEGETVTVAQRMADLLQVAQVSPRFSLFELLSQSRVSPVFLAATFLALLELTRLGHLRLEQAVAFDDIWCVALQGPPEMADVPERAGGES